MSLRVLLTDSDLGYRNDDAQQLRDALGAEVIVAECRTEKDVISQMRLHDPHGVITQWAPITRASLKAAPSCRVISRIGIGVDMIDLASAAELGITVRNVPHYCVEEVATHTVALALSLWRRLPQLERELREGQWNAAAHAPSIGRLSEATIGVVGAGRIGQITAQAFQPWGCRILMVDPIVTDHGFESATLEQLAAESEIICLHAPLLHETYHMLDAEYFSTLQRAPIIVNASRGGLIDLDALNHALSQELVRGAALDVFEEEPLAAEHPIRNQPNALLTPHAAWCSAAALPELRQEAIMNVIRHFRDATRG